MIDKGYVMSDESRNKWSALAAKLLELTQKGVIRWVGSSLDRYPILSSRKTSIVYVGEYADRLLRIYEYEEMRVSLSDDTEYMAQDICLDFIDRDGVSLFEVPKISGIWDLLAAVKYQFADVDEFLEKIGIR